MAHGKHDEVFGLRGDIEDNAVIVDPKTILAEPVVFHLFRKLERVLGGAEEIELAENSPANWLRKFPEVI